MQSTALARLLGFSESPVLCHLLLFFQVGTLGCSQIHGDGRTNGYFNEERHSLQTVEGFFVCDSLFLNNFNESFLRFVFFYSRSFLRY